MVRFSCFNGHIHSHKQKKTVEPSVEATGGTSSNNLTVKDPKTAMNSSLNSVFLKAFSNGQATEGTDDVRSSISFDRSCKSEEVKGKFNVNGDLEVKMGLLKKSRSLGSGLCHEGRAICDNDTQEETDRGFSSDSPGQNGLVEPKCSKSPCLSPTSEHHEPPQSESVQVGSDFVNESSFSMGDPKHSEKDKLENYDSPISGEVVNESANHVSSIPRNAHMIVKSHSLPSIRHSTPTSDVYSYKYLPPHSRSSEDLHVLEMKSKEVSFHEAERWVMQNRERDDVLCETERSIFDNYVDDGYDTYDYSPLAKDWIMPVTDEVNMTKNIQGESSYQQSEESPGKDFKTKRILEWVNDLSHCSPLEENDVLSESDDPAKQDSSYSNGLAATKMDNKVTSPGMEAAKRYISSLNASAATAQLSNHGLVVIPFLSAFASMRVLSLSGNSILRITAGALPRGLHVLNLSKNSISTIEGLRDLTRLRVLDLSYNRILRIGHGLASCSSLKELYLAGNKISEVEGLHRLLKLAVLDLRFNKISTAKCLGQLAANYNSIQAISLEGNPAQKNVGDEQLKKYLQGLLPHLVYFNRQPIKVSTLKDAADRSVRLGMSGHQLDRGLRSDKGARKASHGSRPSSSAIHGRKNQATDSPKRSRGRHVRLPPPSGTRPVASRLQNFDLANKILQLKSEFSMRRSRSEGTLGAF